MGVLGNWGSVLERYVGNVGSVLENERMPVAH